MRDYTLDMRRPAAAAMLFPMIAAFLTPGIARADAKSGAEESEVFQEESGDATSAHGKIIPESAYKDGESKTDAMVEAGVSALGAAVTVGGSASIPNTPPPKDLPKTAPSRRTGTETTAVTPSSSPENDKATRKALPKSPSSSAASPARSAASRAARSKAKEMGANLLRDLKSSEDAGSALSVSPRADAPANASAMPSRKEKLDLVALASSGYQPVFQSLGLKAGAGSDGRPTIVATDGRPADERLLATLSARLEETPKALLKRPDFFKVLPESAYERLKRRWKGLNSARSSAFKDVGLAGNRDFLWSRSCAAVSGDCNPYSSERSYGANEDVSPETLKNIDGLGDGADGPPASREQGAGRAAKQGGLQGILSALAAKWLGVRDAVDASPMAATDAAPGVASENFPERSLRTIEPPEPGARPDEPPTHSPARPRRKGPFAALGAALLAVAAWLWRRKSAASSVGDRTQ